MNKLEDFSSRLHKKLTTIICKFPKKLHLQLKYMEKLLTNFSSNLEDNSQEKSKFSINSIKFSLMPAMLSLISVRLMPLSTVENNVCLQRPLNLRDYHLLHRKTSSGLSPKDFLLISVYLIPPIEVEHPPSPTDKSKK